MFVYEYVCVFLSLTYNQIYSCYFTLFILKKQIDQLRAFISFHWTESGRKETCTWKEQNHEFFQLETGMNGMKEKTSDGSQ